MASVAVGLFAALTILVLCAFWIATGWNAGGGAASLSGVACCLFAAFDDPTPALKKMVVTTVLSVGAVGIGLFGILPRVHDFVPLTIALGAFFVPVGLLIAMPATQALGAGLGFLTATFLSLQSAMQPILCPTRMAASPHCWVWRAPPLSPR